jgi:cyclophilin family peptidyl-prolyl cis-trans isomerase
MKWQRGAFLLLGLILLLGAGCASSKETSVDNSSAATSVQTQTESTIQDEKTYMSPGILPAAEIQNKQIRINTARGDMVFELFPDTAPITVSNFVYLAKEGYYDGLIFHRREEGFVIQGGDPLGTGRGGPGYTFTDELLDSYTYGRGIVAMANRGPNTNGSQFFIMLADYPLPKNYTIFGRVTQGMEVVDGIQVGDEMIAVTVEEKE